MKTFDPRSVDVLIAGLNINSGLAPDGDFVSAEPSGVDFEMVQGIDGEAARVAKYGSKTGKAVVRVLQTSDGNTTLSALRLLDTGNPNGGGLGAFAIIDRSGGLIVEAESACIEGVPKVARGGSVGVVEWTLLLTNCSWTINGNPAV
jgi:hypothetical protein